MVMHLFVFTCYVYMKIYFFSIISIHIYRKWIIGYGFACACVFGALVPAQVHCSWNIYHRFGHIASVHSKVLHMYISMDWFNGKSSPETMVFCVNFPISTCAWKSPPTPQVVRDPFCSAHVSLFPG